MLSFDSEARSVKSNIDSGLPPTLDASIDIGAMNDADAIELLDTLKPSLYAVTAVLGDMVLNYTDKYREDLPPFGLETLVEPVTGGDWDISKWDLKTIEKLEGFQDLGNAMVTTVENAQKSFFEKSQGSPHFQAWYQYTDQLLGYFRDSPVSPGGNYSSPSVFLDGGLGMAISTSKRTLDLVDHAHKQFAPDASDAEILETARRAKRIPYKLAKTIALERIAQAMDSLAGKNWDIFMLNTVGFDLDRFQVTPSSKNPNILNIKFDDESLAYKGDTELKLNSIPLTLGHLGCPGLVDFSTPDDPFSHSVERIHLDMIKSATDLGLWRNDKRVPATIQIAF